MQSADSVEFSGFCYSVEKKILISCWTYYIRPTMPDWHLYRGQSHSVTFPTT